MNDENIRWMNAKITESNEYVRVEFAKKNTITATEMKCLNEFANKNNLTLIGVAVNTDPFYTVFTKNKIIVNTENKPISQ